MAQTFFNAGENCLLVAAFEIDDAVGFQAGLRECWREEVRSRDVLEHLAPDAGGDAGREEHGRGAVDCAVSSAGDLMQRATREPAARKPRVHSGDTEGQHRCGALVPAFDLPDLDAQRLKGGQGPQSVRCPPRAR